VHRFEASVGDLLECGVSGMEREDGVPLAPGSFRFPIANRETRTHSEFVGQNGDTSFRVVYDVLPGVQ
jgi:hypothetical protein